MRDLGKIVRYRLIFLGINISMCFFAIINYLNGSLLPKFIEYGQYQSVNVFSKILNISIEENLDEKIKEKIIVDNVGEVVSIDFNVEILNSIACNITNRSYQLLYELESGKLNEKVLKDLYNYGKKEDVQKGIVYEIPISMIVGNSLIGNLGVSIPIRYKFVGDIKWQIITNVEEYGVNNAFIEIFLKVDTNSKVLIPLVTKEQNISVNIPIVFKIIQGKVPSYYLGSQIIGGN